MLSAIPFIAYGGCAFASKSMPFHWFYKHFGSHWGCCSRSRSLHMADVRLLQNQCFSISFISMLARFGGAACNRVHADTYLQHCGGVLRQDNYNISYSMIRGRIVKAEPSPHADEKYARCACSQTLGAKNKVSTAPSHFLWGGRARNTLVHIRQQPLLASWRNGEFCIF